ncbi:MAG: PDZ domain-containing protein [Tepidisphaeraceae bacterium]
MKRHTLLALFAATALVTGCANPSTTKPTASIASTTVSPADIVARASKSLVTVQYTWDNEMGKRELSGVGVIVRADGLVALPMGLIPLGIPDVQLTQFKVILPRQSEVDEPKELDAEFIARDERCDLAYVKVKPDASSPRTFTPIEFGTSDITIGDDLVSVGLLSKQAGYTPYARMATVATKLRGIPPTVMTSGGLAGLGATVFNARTGKLVGLVLDASSQNLLAAAGRNAGGGRGNGDQESAAEIAQLMLAPIFFVPIDDFLVSLSDPPDASSPRKRAWLGVSEMKGLEEDVAAFYGVKDKPAIQVADVIKGFPAEQGGLRSGDIILTVNGHPLQRGDLPEELPMILQRQLLRMNVGDKVTFGVIRKAGETPRDVVVTLGERPQLANVAPRQFFEDLGYSVRDLVFDDRYARKLDPEYKGVAVAFVKPQSSAAAGQLQRGDIITKLNQTAIENVAQFKTAYEDFRKKSPKEAVVLEVFRGTGTEIVRVQPPQ